MTRMTYRVAALGSLSLSPPPFYNFNDAMPDSPALSRPGQRLGGKRVSFRPIFLIIFILFLRQMLHHPFRDGRVHERPMANPLTAIRLYEQSDVFLGEEAKSGIAGYDVRSASSWSSSRKL